MNGDELLLIGVAATMVILVVAVIAMILIGFQRRRAAQRLSLAPGTRYRTA